MITAMYIFIHVEECFELMLMSTCQHSHCDNATVSSYNDAMFSILI